MTTSAIIIAIAIIVLLILSGLWELLAWWALGPIKEWDDGAFKWLTDGRVQLSPTDTDVIYKPLRFGEHTNRKVHYIKKHRPTLFSTYFVEAPDDGTFRILKGSPLHKAVKKKHDELLKAGFYKQINL